MVPENTETLYFNSMVTVMSHLEPKQPSKVLLFRLFSEVY